MRIMRIRRAISFMIVVAGILLGSVFGWQPQGAWATIGAGCGACQATPSCAGPVAGVDDCGNSCVVPQQADVCQGGIAATCSAPSSGATTTCTHVACVNPQLDCTTWKPYGFSLPGDPVYGFSDCFSNPDTNPLLGLIAKGNVVLGNPFSANFKNKAVPRLEPGADSITQPYMVDPTDAAIGYTDAGNPTLCGGRSPCFNGDYNRDDVFGDGITRKFYEPSLAQGQFETLFDDHCADGACDVFYNPASSSVMIDAVLFTNHALVGYVPAKKVEFTGALVSRDEAVVFNEALLLNHDIRLLRKSALDLGMPAGIERPRLVSWRECPASGCS